MISFITNRPALQIGTHQVIDYDTTWLDAALERAAAAADCGEFPFVADIRTGIEIYLESKCSLKLLSLDELFEKVRRMLLRIGCAHIAENLRPLAPPITFCLIPAAILAGNGFELAFFEKLRADLVALREAGAETIHFTGLRESSRILKGAAIWDRHCDALHTEIRAFLSFWDTAAGFETSEEEAAPGIQ